MPEHRGEEPPRVPSASLPPAPTDGSAGAAPPPGGAAPPAPPPSHRLPAGATPARPAAVRPSARLSEGYTCNSVCCLSKGAAPADSPCLLFFSFFCFALPDSDALFPSPRRHVGVSSPAQLSPIPGLASITQQELFRNKKAPCCKRSPARFLTPFVMHAFAAGENASMCTCEKTPS